MNETDRRDLLAAVTEGKTRSDFMTFAIHAHQFADAKGGERGAEPAARPTISTPTRASPTSCRCWPRQAIDAGADAFLGTGVHVLRGIEIYKGRPIFYGLGEFFRQMDVVGLVGHGRPRTAATTTARRSSTRAIVAVCALRARHPGARSACTRSSSPTTCGWRIAACRASPRRPAAQRILTRLQKLSAPLGTTIAIEGNIGVIRVAATSSGQP